MLPQEEASSTPEDVLDSGQGLTMLAPAAKPVIVLSVAPCEAVTGLKGTGREAGDLAPAPILPSAWVW